jgi:hypothetical protein
MPQCTATNRQGNPCGNKAENGTTVCHMHGAKAPQTKNKAQQRIQEATARKYAETLGLPIIVDPHTALLDELHKTAGTVAWLADNIRNQGHIVTPEGTPTTWLRLWQQERDRLANVAEKCARAGVEERRVAMVEDQARIVSQLLRAVLVDCGVPLDEATTRVVRRHIELMPVMAEG